MPTSYHNATAPNYTFKKEEGAKPLWSDKEIRKIR